MDCPVPGRSIDTPAAVLQTGAADLRRFAIRPRQIGLGLFVCLLVCVGVCVCVCLVFLLFVSFSVCSHFRLFEMCSKIFEISCKNLQKSSKIGPKMVPNS